jgi:hypothetical protein
MSNNKYFRFVSGIDYFKEINTLKDKDELVRDAY